ncbi:MAG: hypothetical protein WDM78_06155 [Puia sp.]
MGASRGILGNRNMKGIDLLAKTIGMKWQGIQQGGILNHCVFRAIYNFLRMVSCKTDRD